MTGFRDVIPNSPLPNRLTLSHLVNSFHDTGSVQDKMLWLTFNSEW